MYRQRRICLLLVIAGALPVTAGCLVSDPKGSGNQVQQPPDSASIPLKVWVVLAQGQEMEEDGSPPENRTNKGCRLTESEIRARVQILQNNSCLYGPNLNLEWDKQLNIVPWSQLALLPEGQRFRSTPLFLAEVLLAPEFYEEDQINFYFAGWISVNQSTLDFGVTLEPTVGMDTPCIIINDAGFFKSSGFAFGWVPAETVGWYVPEHELGHYIGRFVSTCYPRPNGTRCYDAGEHSLENYNLMKTPPPVPLYLPGSFDDPNTEQGETGARIRDGLWNDP